MTTNAESPVVVEVVRYRCGAESVLGQARVASGEPYISAHHDSDNFDVLVAGLAVTGHAFRVEIVDRDVCLLEMVDRKANAAARRPDANRFPTEDHQ